MPENTAPLLTIGEAARYLGVSVDTLRRWDSDGRLRSIRLTAGGHRRYRRDEIESLLTRENGDAR